MGDVINYSYLVKNTGNVTLAGPGPVTDDKATVTCPAGGLAPGASMTCTASYTITQADLDSGSVKNTAQAHANGTDSNFDDETVTAVQSPHLSITKVATESSYSAVGDVIHYTIKATNDGNTTLAAVTVTDPNVSGLSCTPANGSPLVPGASMTCTATHTVTQADLDAGHYANQACVDDGAGGAAQACASQDVPGTKVISQITPTNTTCQDFRGGTAATLSTLNYSVKSGKVSAVNPGVFFYWVKVTVTTTGSKTFTINQAITTGNFPNHFFQSASGSTAWTSTCTKITTQVTQSGGVTTVKFNATQTGTVYIGIKYDSKSVDGFAAPNPTKVHYAFSTTGVPGSTSGLDLDVKPAAAAPQFQPPQPPKK